MRGYVHVAGRHVHYHRCGAGPAVVLLHQSPSAATMYRDLLPVLGRRFQAVAFDLPGYGGSDPLDDPSIEGLAGSILGGLDGLGIDRAHFVGVHTGATIAIALASSHPDRVGRLVLYGVPDYGGDGGRARDRLAAIQRHPAAGGAHLLDAWRRFRVKAPHIDLDTATLRVLEELRAGPDSSRVSVAVTTYDVRARLAKLHAPTLVLTGSNDRFYLESVGVAVHIAGARRQVIDGASNLVCSEAPDTFADAIVSFLAGG